MSKLNIDDIKLNTMNINVIILAHLLPFHNPLATRYPTTPNIMNTRPARITDANISVAIRASLFIPVPTACSSPARSRTSAPTIPAMNNIKPNINVKAAATNAIIDITLTPVGLCLLTVKLLLAFFEEVLLLPGFDLLNLTLAMASLRFFPL